MLHSVLLFMKKVQIFSASDPAALQQQVNEWLGTNKDADVIHSNMAVQGDAATNKCTYSFYILYTIVNEAAKEIEVLRAENSPSIEITEVPPDLLEPTN